jgi:ubiquinone/menaquinone biosynthesis C-methylase UbiE
MAQYRESLLQRKGQLALTPPAAWADVTTSFTQMLPTASSTVLCVGPGSGEECVTLVGLGHDVWAVEILDESPLLEAAAKKHGFDVRLGVHMEELPFPDDSFDIVFAHHVLEHSMMPLVALAEWNRVLTVGGLLAVGVPPPHVTAVSLHICNFSAPMLAYMMAVAGFSLAPEDHRFQELQYDLRFVTRKVSRPFESLYLDDLQERFPPGAFAAPGQLLDVWTVEGREGCGLPPINGGEDVSA